MASVPFAVVAVGVGVGEQMALIFELSSDWLREMISADSRDRRSDRECSPEFFAVN